MAGRFSVFEHPMGHGQLMRTGDESVSLGSQRRHLSLGIEKQQHGFRVDRFGHVSRGGLGNLGPRPRGPQLTAHGIQ